MKIIHTMQQNSLDWHRVRCGRLTASKLSEILKPSSLQLSAQAEGLALTIAAERIKGKPEETPQTFDMERGVELETEARTIYHENFYPVREVGFIENNSFGFQFGASPDGLLLNENGAIEIKCPRAKTHLEAILDRNISGGYDLQMQGCMLAGELDFVDFVSYHEGLKMRPIRVLRNKDVINAIVEAGRKIEDHIQSIIALHSQCVGVETNIAREIAA